MICGDCGLLPGEYGCHECGEWLCADCLTWHDARHFDESGMAEVIASEMDGGDGSE